MINIINIGFKHSHVPKIVNLITEYYSPIYHTTEHMYELNGNTYIRISEYENNRTIKIIIIENYYARKEYYYDKTNKLIKVKLENNIENPTRDYKESDIFKKSCCLIV